MSYCGNCGTHVGTAAYCPACGAHQNAEPTSHTTAPTNPSDVAADLYSGWGLRAAALTLDSIILVCAWLAAVVIAGQVAGKWGQAVIGNPGIFLLPALYYTIGHGGASGQTVGKKAAGIAVKDAKTRASIGYARAFGRWFVTMLLIITAAGTLLDYLWPTWDARRQALHDKAVSSAVYRWITPSQSA